MSNQHNFPLLGQAFIGNKILSASAHLSGTDSGKAFVNTQATAGITVSLPKAAPGLRFIFVETVAHNIVITPVSTDAFRGSAAGATKTLSGLGQNFLITCVIPGFWELF